MIMMETGRERARPNWRTVCSLLLIPVLAGVVLTEYEDRFEAGGMDFYSFWEVAEAQRFSGGTLGAPYINGFAYLQVERQVVLSAFDDHALLRNALYWHGRAWDRGATLLPTPLLYTSFALFPRDFSYALNIYNWGHLVVFLLGMFLLGTVLSCRPLPTLLASLVLLATCYPLQQDLFYGNVGIVLLFGLAGFLAACAYADVATPREALGLRLFVSAGLIVLTLFKPLVLIPCMLLLLYQLAQGGAWERWAIGVASAAAVILCITIPSWYFTTWAIWTDWLVHLSTDRHLLQPLSNNNHSLVMMSAEWSGLHPSTISLIFGGTCLVTILWAIGRRGKGGVRMSSDVLLDSLRDPVMVVSIGILVTLATAPLVWPHYNVLAVIPAMWLITRPTHRGLFQGLVLALLLMNLGIAMDWVALNNLPLPRLLAQGGTWIPLWLGMLVAIQADPASALR